MTLFGYAFVLINLERNVVCKMVYITFVHSFLVYVRQKVFLHNYEF